MIRYRIVLCGLLFLIFCMYTISSAQGFSSLIEKLDNLEKRLDAIETKITNQPQDAGGLSKLESKVSRLEADLKKLDSGNTGEFIEESIVELHSKVQTLENKYAVASFGDIEPGDAQILYDLSTLTSELRDAIEGEYDQIGSDSKSDLGLEISGFVDASYFYDVASGDNTFGFDQTEIDIEKSLGEEGSIRVDLEWVNDGLGGFDLDAEQGYVTYSPLALKTTGFTFGKFNAPIGFELLDPHDMYQFSHALVFNYGLPTNLTGLMVNQEIESGFDLTAYLTNGWDENFDFNQGKTIGGRIGYSPDSRWAVGFSAITGDQDESLGDTTTLEHKLTVFDVDLTITPNEKLTIGGEYNQGTDEVSGITYKWAGFLAMFHYDLNDLLGFTMRYDYFDDKDGTRLGSGISEKRTALTFCPTFSLGNGMGALIEYRMDLSDKEVFTDKDGLPSKSTSNFAFEMTYSF